MQSTVGFATLSTNELFGAIKKLKDAGKDEAGMQAILGTLNQFNNSPALKMKLMQGDASAMWFAQNQMAMNEDVEGQKALRQMQAENSPDSLTYKVFKFTSNL